MFDNLREQANQGDSDVENDFSRKVPPLDVQEAPAASPGRLFGMTAGQRFVIAVLMMLSACALGAMCLLVTGRIGAF